MFAKDQFNPNSYTIPSKYVTQLLYQCLLEGFCSALTQARLWIGLRSEEGFFGKNQPDLQVPGQH